jgi:hypothetical protein
VLARIKDGQEQRSKRDIVGRTLTRGEVRVVAGAGAARGRWRRGRAVAGAGAARGRWQGGARWLI